jgi:phenylalanyl-tRNA synthetase alpha chain
MTTDTLTTPNIDQLIADVTKAQTIAELEAARVSAIGKTGVIAQWVSSIASLPVEQRKDEGQKRNLEKQRFVTALEARKVELERQALNAKLEAERVDVTLPIRTEAKGSIHPLSQTIDEIIEIFAQWGFVFSDGPSIESDDNNFTKLNIPPDHPATPDARHLLHAGCRGRQQAGATHANFLHPDPYHDGAKAAHSSAGCRPCLSQ